MLETATSALSATSALAFVILATACGTGAHQTLDATPGQDSSVPDAPSDAQALGVDALGGDALQSDAAFRARLIATFDWVTRAFSINPRATRDTGSLSVGGAEFGGELLGLTVLDASGVQIKTYQCSDGGVYFAYVHNSVAWVTRADMPCIIDFTRIPTGPGEVAAGTFSATLIRQDGQPGTMLVENGSFEVLAEN